MNPNLSSMLGAPLQSNTNQVTPNRGFAGNATRSPISGHHMAPGPGGPPGVSPTDTGVPGMMPMLGGGGHSGPGPGSGGVAVGPGSGGLGLNQQMKELPNTALFFCRLGQETVQEIVTKASDLFTLLKGVQPPNGTQTAVTVQEDRKVKLQDILRTIGMLFNKLRKLYEKCNESCLGMEYIQMETLIPLKEDTDLPNKQSQDDRKSSDQVKYRNEERREYVEQLKLRNRQLKEVIDSLRSLVWEINTMLAMRKP